MCTGCPARMTARVIKESKKKMSLIFIFTIQRIMGDWRPNSAKLLTYIDI